MKASMLTPNREIFDKSIIQEPPPGGAQIPPHHLIQKLQQNEVQNNEQPQATPYFRNKEYPNTAPHHLRPPPQVLPGNPGKHPGTSEDHRRKELESKPPSIHHMQICRNLDRHLLFLT